MSISINGMSNNGLGTVVIRENDTSEKAKGTAEKREMEKGVVQSDYAAVSRDGDTLTISKAGSKASADSDDGSEDTSDLSGYSESELQSLLQSGAITRSEYNEEIKSREA